ncbi:cytochrome P450 [Sporosarcina sp. P3]|uniref:cytochrome P450 n=1 Tax=Sporosarcina sp. P3 TaxID=2048245 RepID=UPI000C16EBB8|nr:cytochrome P450 [Sporosarcina sp. P3]PID21783.1 cytochrome P450 [Sporosarcina sp. P3]
MTTCPYSQKKVTYLIPIKELRTEEDFLNIHTWLADMRKNSPVRFDESRQCWDIFLYEDVDAIFRNSKEFSSVRKFHAPTPLRSILNMDPPEHTKLRKLVSKAFTPRALSKLGPRIEELSNELIQQALPSGKIDVVNEYAYSLTINMLVNLLGVPEKDSELFKTWSADLLASPKDASDEAYNASVSHVKETMDKVDSYLLTIINERRESPQEDLITELTQAEIDGEHLTDEEILDFAGILLQAGFGTTARLITNFVRSMLENPGLFEKLKNDSSLINPAMEEVLRLYPSIYRTTRYAKESFTIRDQTIHEGDEIQLWVASANRDEAIFDQPNTFLIDRKPNQHLAFGKGIHFCLGSSLARLEAKIAIEVFVKNVSSIQLLDTQLKPIRSMVANGLEELNISIQP